MDYIAKLSRLLDSEIDTGWEVERHTQELVDRESSMRVFWDDEASRNLWSKYVYPHNEDASRLIGDKQKVVDHTRRIIRHGKEVFVQATTVFSESEEIAVLLKEADGELDNSAHSLEYSGKYVGKVDQWAPVVDGKFAEEPFIRQSYREIYDLRHSVYEGVIS